MLALPHLFYACAGADGGNIFKLRIGSTTIVGVRRYDLHVAKNASCLSWQPLIILEGPTEPSQLEDILKPTVDFFVNHDPGTSSYRGCPNIQYLIHTVFSR